jgi:hypothetical protein
LAEVQGYELAPGYVVTGWPGLGITYDPARVVDRVEAYDPGNPGEPGAVPDRAVYFTDGSVEYVNGEQFATVDDSSRVTVTEIGVTLWLSDGTARSYRVGDTFNA